MKIIWSIVGIVVLIIIIAAIYKKGITSNMASTPSPMPSINTNTNTVTRAVALPQQLPIIPIQPIIVVDNLVNCSGTTYQNNLSALYDTYLQKRVIWQSAINTNMNAVQAHADMDTAYNDWWQEARKCNLVN